MAGDAGIPPAGGGEGDKAILRLSKCSKGIPPAGGEGDRRRRRGSRRSERRQGARGTPVAAWGRGLLEDRRWRATRPVYLLGATRRFARRRRHVRVAVSAFPRGGRSFGARRGCAQAQSRRCGRCAAGVPMRVHGAVRRRAGQTSDRRSRANRQKERHVTAEKRAASGGEPHRRDRKQGTGDGAEENGDGAEESRLRRMKRLFPLRKRRQGNAAGSSGRT